MAVRGAADHPCPDAFTTVSGLLKHVPNLLTGLRLASAPAVALLLIGGNNSAALGIFALAGLSDAADGFLAKRFGFDTRFGRFLDPAADKLLMLASFLTLTMTGVTPFWLTALVVGRDLAIVAGVLLVAFLELPIPLRPLFIGKVSTACQIGYVAFALLLLATGRDWPMGLRVAGLATAAATTVSWLGYGYLLAAVSLRRGSNQP